MSDAARVERRRVNGRSPGRPRDAAIDEIVLRATIDLLVHGGLESCTIQAVSDRTGIARTTIYLRWPGRTALILAALRWAIDRPPMLLSGDIATDLRRGGERAREVLNQETFLAALPTLMEAFIRPDDAAPGLTFDSLFPTRRALIEDFKRRAADQGYRTDLDPVVLVDMLLGAMLMRLLTSGKPPSRRFGNDVVDLLLAAARPPSLA